MAKPFRVIMDQGPEGGWRAYPEGEACPREHRDPAAALTHALFKAEPHSIRLPPPKEGPFGMEHTALVLAIARRPRGPACA